MGDIEEHVALRHLLLAGLDVQVVDGTAPQLPESDLMHLAYVQRSAVKPFVAEVPAREELERRVEVVERVLTSPDLFAAVAGMPEELLGTTRRIAA